MNCPVCGLRCVMRLNSDMIECPEHGEIFGLTLMQIGDARGWEALLEIRAAQLKNHIWHWFRQAEAML